MKTNIFRYSICSTDILRHDLLGPVRKKMLYFKLFLHVSHICVQSVSRNLPPWSINMPLMDIGEEIIFFVYYQFVILISFKVVHLFSVGFFFTFSKKKELWIRLLSGQFAPSSGSILKVSILLTNTYLLLRLICYDLNSHYEKDCTNYESTFLFLFKAFTS